MKGLDVIATSNKFAANKDPWNGSCACNLFQGILIRIAIIHRVEFEQHIVFQASLAQRRFRLFAKGAVGFGVHYNLVFADFKFDFADFGPDIIFGPLTGE